MWRETTHANVCHYSGGGNNVFKCVPWLCTTCLIQMCATSLGEMTRANMCHDSWRNDSFQCVPWHLGTWIIHRCAISVWDIPHSKVCHDSGGHDSFTCLIQICAMTLCDVTHSDVCRESFTSIVRLIQICYDVGHDWFKCVPCSGTWLIQMCVMILREMTLPNMRHALWDMTIIWMHHSIHTDESWHEFDGSCPTY